MADEIRVKVTIEVTEHRACDWVLSRAEVVEAGYDPADPRSLRSFIRDDRNYEEILDAMNSKSVVVEMLSDEVEAVEIL